MDTSQDQECGRNLLGLHEVALMFRDGTCNLCERQKKDILYWEESSQNN